MSARMNPMVSDLCSAWTACLSWCWREWDEEHSAAWDRGSSLFWVQSWKGRIRKRKRRRQLNVLW
jgi:hypothetical protein